MKYGRLTVVDGSEVYKYNKNGRRKFVETICVCGNKKSIQLSNIQNGNTKSCGCLAKEVSRGQSNLIHGMYGTPTHQSWEAMKDRCTRKSCSGYSRYGGRGITFCDEWSKFANFWEDMGERPQGHTLDRVDSDGNYNKENCRWADIHTQQNNKESTIFIEYNGIKKSLSDWHYETGIPRPTLYRRQVIQGLPPHLVLAKRKLSKKEVRDNQTTLKY